jgi:hypothetical protein
VDRLSVWRTDLSRTDQSRIISWADRLGINMYTSDILPYNSVSIGQNGVPDK